MLHIYLTNNFHYDPETGEFRRIQGDQYGPRLGYNTYSHKTGKPDSRYLTVKVPYSSDMPKQYAEHRLAWFYMTGKFPPKGKEIDHINGDPFDNRWSNLRLATHAQNMANRKIHSSNKSGYKGVYYVTKAKMYQACLQHKNIKYYMGPFDTPEEASEAYSLKAQELQGEFFSSQFLKR